MAPCYTLIHDNTNTQNEYVCYCDGNTLYGYYVDASGAVKNISHTIPNTT